MTEEEARLQKEAEAAGTVPAVGQKRQAPEGGHRVMEQSQKEKLMRAVAIVNSARRAFGVSLDVDEAGMLSTHIPDNAE